ncbi:MAG: hypothetical protein HGA33_05720 [Candidatus Moranbacteria bacterium]|nr:hypothetical protein [Candidatus Moranbacteria bacterium]
MKLEYFPEHQGLGKLKSPKKPDLLEIRRAEERRKLDESEMKKVVDFFNKGGCFKWGDAIGHTIMRNHGKNISRLVSGGYKEYRKATEDDVTKLTYDPGIDHVVVYEISVDPKGFVEEGVDPTGFVEEGGMKGASQKIYPCRIEDIPKNIMLAIIEGKDSFVEDGSEWSYKPENGSL